VTRAGNAAEGSIDGKYRLLERLAVEGDVERHLAEHTAIRRAVELCCLAPGVGADAEAAGRLSRTARVLGGATHPGLQGVVDSGRDAAGRPYVVLEALRGKTLGQLTTEPMELRRAARIAVQVLEALRALHEAGVVLRCLGPDDVMLETVGAGDERVKLRGVAGAAFVREEAPPLRVTRYTAYLAPELRRGELGLDPRVDLFSVGVLLRQLLTGSPRGALDGLPDTARRALARACADDPEERFASVEGFLQAVALLLPTTDRPPREQLPTPADPLQADLQYLHLRRTTRHGPRGTPERESRLSLLPVLLTIEAIYRRFGPGVWAELCREVEEAETLLPGAGHTPVHMERGVPVALFSEVLVAVDSIAGRGDLGLLTELGEAIARRGLLRLFPDLPQPVTPDALISGWPYLWSRIGRDGRAKVQRTGDGSARLSVERQVTPSLELAGLVAGIVRRGLLEAGASEAQVLLISSEALGDARDLYGVEWG
jgi:serine/threonine-protein kinase